MNQNTAPPCPSVVRYRDSNSPGLTALLLRFGLAIREVPGDRPIPGSFWGAEEAGLLGSTVLVRADTPLHSILHEACHYICMDEARRALLDTNAGGDHDEENAVCYLQILLADEIPGYGRDRMMKDMDAARGSSRTPKTPARGCNIAACSPGPASRPFRTGPAEGCRFHPPSSSGPTALSASNTAMWTIRCACIRT